MSTLFLFVTIVLGSILGTLIAGAIALSLFFGGLAHSMQTVIEDNDQAVVGAERIYHAPNGTKVRIA